MWRRLKIAVVLLAAFGACTPKRQRIEIATTTSLTASGLFDVLRARFLKDSGIEVNAFALGSGQAMRMAERGQVDVIITHDPVNEKIFTARVHAAMYRQFMWNEFVIVGPKGDPASIRASASAVDAFRRIHAAQEKFCSRNDQSGTNVKELALWRAAAVTPESNPNYLRLGQSMANLLRSSEELQAYTLSDRATFDQLSPQLSLGIVYQGDPVLRNVYAITLMERPASNNYSEAEKFARWLLSDAGRRVIESFTVRGHHEFFWIASRSNENRPDDLLNSVRKIACK